jgi:hypothetical protein
MCAYSPINTIQRLVVETYSDLSAFRNTEYTMYNDTMSPFAHLLAQRLVDYGPEPVGGAATDRAGRRISWILDRMTVTVDTLTELIEKINSIVPNNAVHSAPILEWARERIYRFDSLVADVLEAV